MQIINKKIGRPIIIEFSEAEIILKRYFDLEIGLRECKKLLGLSEKNKSTIYRLINLYKEKYKIDKDFKNTLDLKNAQSKRINTLKKNKGEKMKNNIEVLKFKKDYRGINDELEKSFPILFKYAIVHAKYSEIERGFKLKKQYKTYKKGTSFLYESFVNPEDQLKEADKLRLELKELNEKYSDEEFKKQYEEYERNLK